MSAEIYKEVLDLTPLKEEETVSIKLGEDIIKLKVRELYEQAKKPEIDIELDPEGFTKELSLLFSKLIGKDINTWQTEVLFNYALNYVEQLFKKK